MSNSRILVTLQLALITGLLVLGGKAVFQDVRLLAGCALSLLLIVHATLAMRPEHVRIAPEPHPGAELCERGIYRWIRHPMYTGTLAGFVFVAWGAGGWLAWWLWLALAAVLWAKLRLEERYWLERNPGYAGYMRRTKRLVPYLF